MTESTKITTTVETTKDAGRVKLGAGFLHFGETTTARETTKDAGRVKLGAGFLRF